MGLEAPSDLGLADSSESVLGFLHSGSWATPAGVGRRAAKLALVLVLLPAAPAAAATFTVNTNGDNAASGTECMGAPSDCSLRQAIDKATSAASATTIAFSLPMPATISLTNGSLSICTTHPVTITGPGANELTVNNTSGALTDGVFAFNCGTASMSGITVTGGNTSGSITAAGIDYGSSGALTLDGVVVSGNTLSGGGGSAAGIRQDGSGGLTIKNSTISGNSVTGSSGDNAGGIYNNFNGPLTVINTTIANNIVTGSGANPDGGGIVNGGDAGSPTTLVNVTIAGNSAAKGAGGLQNDSGSISRLANTIIATNSGSAAPDCTGTAGTFISQGYNLIGNGSGCGFTAGTGDQVGTSASPVNPQLGALANNGGSTPTMALTAGSPAVDAGNPAAPVPESTTPPSPPALIPCPTIDQRGDMRPDVSGTACDKGAFEYQQPPTPPTEQLTVTKSGSGAGTVTSSPAGINCGATCSASFAQGTMVTLTETPSGTSTFGGWGGACSGMGSCTVTLSAAETVTATFTLPTPKRAPPPTCTLHAKSTLVSRPHAAGDLGGAARKKHKHKKPKPTLIAATVTCTEAANITLTGKLTEHPATKHKRRGHKASSRTLALGPVTGMVSANVAKTFDIKVPSQALIALAKGTKESVVLNLTARNAQGTATVTAKIAALKL